MQANAPLPLHRSQIGARHLYSIELVTYMQSAKQRTPGNKGNNFNQQTTSDQADWFSPTVHILQKDYVVTACRDFQKRCERNTRKHRTGTSRPGRPQSPGDVPLRLLAFALGPDRPPIGERAKEFCIDEFLGSHEHRCKVTDRRIIASRNSCLNMFPMMNTSSLKGSYETLSDSSGGCLSRPKARTRNFGPPPLVCAQICRSPRNNILLQRRIGGGT